MVRIIADTSCQSPTASSCDRYKYRYGCNYHSRNTSKNEREETVYKRPVSASAMKGKAVSKKEKDLIVRDGGEGGEGGEGGKVIENVDGCMKYYIDIIADKFIKANNICDTIDTIIAMRPQIMWATKKCDDDNNHEMKIKEDQEKQEREKEKEREWEEEKRKMMMINKKLGQIIYHSTSGEKFTAFHSIHSHSYSYFDKKTRQMTTITTQKIVWNDKIYNSKEIWFREMAMSSLSADPPMDENVKIMRCM
jgi:hypothetical protein